MKLHRLHSTKSALAADDNFRDFPRLCSPLSIFLLRFAFGSLPSEHLPVVFLLDFAFPTVVDFFNDFFGTASIIDTALGMTTLSSKNNSSTIGG